MVQIQYLAHGLEPMAINARAAIMACPKHVARRIVSGLSQTSAKAMERIQYAPYVTVAIETSDPLFGLKAFDYWISDKERRLTDILDATPGGPRVEPGSRARTYLAFSPRPLAEAESLHDPSTVERIARGVLSALYEHIEGSRERITAAHAFFWSSAMPIASVGSHMQVFPHHAMQHGRILFANSDNDLVPSIENAVDAGSMVAEEIDALLKN
jgi:hypothetical protein